MELEEMVVLLLPGVMTNLYSADRSGYRYQWTEDYIREAIELANEIKEMVSKVEKAIKKNRENRLN